MFLRRCSIICAAVFLVSYLSPQLGFYGRGLRVGLPAFCLAVAFAFMGDAAAVARALHRGRWILICGSIFIAQSLVRYLSGHDPSFFDVFVSGAAQVLMATYLILLARSFGRRELQLLAHLVFLGAGISLCIGIPVLLARPGVARDIMLMSTLGYAGLQQYSAQGVGTYTQYTAVAIAFFPLMLWLMESRGKWRIPYAVILVGVAWSVFVSTFTMAAVFLAGGAVAGLCYWVVHRHRGTAVIRVLFIVTLAGAVSGTIIATAAQSRPFMFAYDKATLLWDHVSVAGWVQGDQTGRSVMFKEDLLSFISSPLFGVGGGHGHSSLINTLSAHGILGAVWWFAVLFMLFRMSLSAIKRPLLRRAISVAWLMYFASGVLNPTWHFAAVTATVFLFLLALEPSAEEPVLAYGASSAELAHASEQQMVFQ